MPLQFWPLTFFTATYLINRLPTPTLQNESPFLRLFKMLLNYNKLRSFNYLCYPWLRPYTNHKLQPKSTPCLFVGYSPSQSTYYCLDPLTHKIYTSRHVQFFENEFTYMSLTPSCNEDSETHDINAWCPLFISIMPHQTKDPTYTVQDPPSHAPFLSQSPHITPQVPLSAPPLQSTINMPIHSTLSILNHISSKTLPQSHSPTIATDNLHILYQTDQSTHTIPLNHAVSLPLPARHRKPNSKYYNSDYILHTAIQTLSPNFPILQLLANTLNGDKQ